MTMTSYNPAWLGPILKAHFFEPCKIHKHFVTTHFCTDCLGDSLCIACFADNYLQHSTHNLISASLYLNCTVIRAICIQDPKIEMAFSDLQLYDIYSAKESESEPIFLVNQLAEEKREVINSHEWDNKCIICGLGLTDPKSKFCSIECKVKSLDDGNIEPEDINHRVHLSICGLRKRRVTPQSQRISSLHFTVKSGDK